MATRFRKSIKIAPGIKLNLGKKSAGISIGGKYGGVSFNSKTGARARVSAPGTGISYSAKIGESQTSRSSHSAATSTKEPVEKNPTTYLILTIFLGLFGVHRFYRKQYFIGILYLCTAGIGAIGWFVDIFIAVKYFVNSKKASNENTENK